MDSRGNFFKVFWTEYKLIYYKSNQQSKEFMQFSEPNKSGIIKLRNNFLKIGTQ